MAAATCPYSGEHPDILHLAKLAQSFVRATSDPKETPESLLNEHILGIRVLRHEPAIVVRENNIRAEPVIGIRERIFSIVLNPAYKIYLNGLDVIIERLDAIQSQLADKKICKLECIGLRNLIYGVFSSILENHFVATEQIDKYAEAEKACLALNVGEVERLTVENQLNVNFVFDKAPEKRSLWAIARRIKPAEAQKKQHEEMIDFMIRAGAFQKADFIFLQMIYAKDFSRALLQKMAAAGLDLNWKDPALNVSVIKDNTEAPTAISPKSEVGNRSLTYPQFPTLLFKAAKGGRVDLVKCMIINRISFDRTQVALLSSVCINVVVRKTLNAEIERTLKLCDDSEREYRGRIESQLNQIFLFWPGFARELVQIVVDYRWNKHELVQFTLEKETQQAITQPLQITISDNSDLSNLRDHGDRD